MRARAAREKHKIRAAHRKMSVSALITEVKANQQHDNLCSALRLFVLGVYRTQSENISRTEAERVVAHELGSGHQRHF